MAMSWEGSSWLLLKACGVPHHQLLSVLQPYQGRFPITEAEFNAMQLTLRRMGRILEHAPGSYPAPQCVHPSLHGGRRYRRRCQHRPVAVTRPHGSIKTHGSLATRQHRGHQE